MNIALVQLSRYGDICNALPMAWRWHNEGHTVDWIVQEEFADILDAVSYVTPRIWRGGPSEVTQAAEFAKQFSSNVVVAQVNGNHNGRQAPNYTIQNWINAGMAQWYHAPDTRLVFDRRNKKAELEALLQCVPEGGDPIMGLCLSGNSSPFADAGLFRDWAHRRFNKEYRIFDVSDLKLESVSLLLGMIEACDVLISTDTLPLHLSFASGTPVIALTRDDPWSQTERRHHWLGRVTYSEAMTEQARSRIYSMIDRRQEVKDVSRRIIHIADWYEPNDRPTAKRMNRARWTWNEMKKADWGWETVLHQLREDDRSSKDIGDSRRLPYLKDVIDYGRSKANDCDYLVLTNADSCLPMEAPGIIRSALVKFPCAYSHRVDVLQWRPYDHMDLAGCPQYPGADLFAFRASWWDQVRDEFPDLLLACEGWDFIMKRMMAREGTVIEPPIVYHELHQAFWSSADNIHSNPGQIYNRKLCREWAASNGCEQSIMKKGSALFA